MAIFMNGAQGGMVTADNRILERPKECSSDYSLLTAIISIVIVRRAWPTPWTITFDAAGGRMGS